MPSMEVSTSRPRSGGFGQWKASALIIGICLVPPFLWWAPPLFFGLPVHNVFERLLYFLAAYRLAMTFHSCICTGGHFTEP